MAWCERRCATAPPELLALSERDHPESGAEQPAQPAAARLAVRRERGTASLASAAHLLGSQPLIA